MTEIIKFPKIKKSTYIRMIEKMKEDFEKEGFSEDLAAIAATMLFEIMKLERKINRINRRIK